MTHLRPIAPLLVASNRGPLTVVAVDDGDDEIARGGGGLVSGMQAALSATPDAVWVSAALNDRERALARRAPGGRISELPEVAEALHGDFDVRDAADRRADLPQRLQRHRELDAVVRPAPPLRPADPAVLRRRRGAGSGPATSASTRPSPTRWPRRPRPARR